MKKLLQKYFFIFSFVLSVFIFGGSLAVGVLCLIVSGCRRVVAFGCLVLAVGGFSCRLDRLHGFGVLCLVGRCRGLKRADNSAPGRCAQA